MVDPSVSPTVIVLVAVVASVSVCIAFYVLGACVMVGQCAHILYIGGVQEEVKAIWHSYIGQGLMSVFTVYNTVAHPPSQTFFTYSVMLCKRLLFTWHNNIYKNMLQGTSALCTENLDLKGLEMAVKECRILC